NGHRSPLYAKRRLPVQRDRMGEMACRRSSGQGSPPVTDGFRSGVFFVALEQFDRDALRPADEADAHPRADSGRLARELDTLGPDFGGDRVDVLHGQAEMVEPLIGSGRRRVDTVTRRDRGDENVGAAELDVDPVRPADDDPAEDVLQPGRGRLRIGAAQMDVIPGDDRHGLLSHRCALPLVGTAWPRLARRTNVSGGVMSVPSPPARGDPRIAGFPCNQIGIVGVSRMRDVEGLAMAEEGKSWWRKFGPFGRGDLATQAAVLLPVMSIAILSAWTMGARGQSVEPAVQAAVAVQSPSPSDPQLMPAKP